MNADSPGEDSETLTTHQKAFALNLERNKYGTIAEIGGGQETAAWFFRVGGAAGTVAMTISAYDKTFSDKIYGTGERYVSRPRLEMMLNREFESVVSQLDSDRGEETAFFAFANTVVARSYSRPEDGLGWLGIRFQMSPRSEWSQIVIHVRLLDGESTLQQEALGILGVNLIHASMIHKGHPDAVLMSVVDNLTNKRVEVDLIDFSGAGYEGVDNRVISLKLVENGLAGAAMFLASGEVVQPADVLYKKAILIERGSFRPVTVTHLDIINCARARFVQEPQVQDEEILVLTEMHLTSLSREGSGEENYRDFLERVDILSALGKTVLITSYLEFYRLAAYIFRYTKSMIGICMGVATLKEVFEEKYYEDLAGGILESFGRLFKNDLKLYVYPMMDENTGAVISAGNLRVAPHLRHLCAYLTENRFIEGLRGYDESCLRVHSREVLEKIENNDVNWEHAVPAFVAHRIMERRLFGYTGAQPPALEDYLRQRNTNVSAQPKEVHSIEHFNEDQFREAAGNDAEIAASLLSGLEEEMTLQINELRCGAGDEESDVVREVAQSIRGTASSLGCLEIQSIASEIENEAGDGYLDDCELKITRLMESLDRLKENVAGISWNKDS